MQARKSLDIAHIFLTHDHLDHLLGLGGLFLSLSLRRANPVPHVAIHGGNTALDRAQTLAAMIRSSGTGKALLKLDYAEVAPGTVYETGELAVTAFPTNHRERPCFGYVFQSKGRDRLKIVFTGDTGYMDSLVEVAQGADCLVSEANFATEKQDTAIRVGHLTSVQAAEIAVKAGVKCLMLNHVSREYADSLDRILAEAKAIFSHTLLPSDLDSFQISSHGVYHVPK